jgi:hypothetical protein
MLVSASLVLAAIAVRLLRLPPRRVLRSEATAIPPGLANKLLNPNSGILIALAATVGSNSRLQDLPVSP